MRAAGMVPQSRARAVTGFGLTEALVATALLALLIGAASELFAGLLRSESILTTRAAVVPEAQRALQALVDAVATTPHLQLPNGRCRAAEQLVLSAGIDADGDGLADEDPGPQIFGMPGGTPGEDDDGDDLVDESPADDDDEDGAVDEDPRNGRDDDGDGSIDEDCGADASGDGVAGVRRIDDDDDGSIDEGDSADDDEDGRIDEDGADLRRFWFDKPSHVLYEQRPAAQPFVLLGGVVGFECSYLTGAAGEPLVEIRVRVAADDDEVDLVTRVYPGNQQAHHGIEVP